MSIKITNLRPGVIALVQSDPKRYDPNGNGVIDDGDELAQLMAEYGTSDENDLMFKYVSGDGFDSSHNGPIYTNQEKLDADKRAKDKKDFFVRDVLGCFGAVGALMASIGIGSAISEHTNIRKMPKGPKKLAALLGAAVLVASPFVALIGAFHVKDKINRDEALMEIKAEQAERAIQYRQDIAEEDELARQAEDERNQDELQYRQDLADATSETNDNMTEIQRKTERINKELDNTKKTMDKYNKDEQEKDSVEA